MVGSVQDPTGGRRHVSQRTDCGSRQRHLSARPVSSRRTWVRLLPRLAPPDETFCRKPVSGPGGGNRFLRESGGWAANLIHKNHYRFATTIIVTKLAIICATVANTGKMSALGPCSFIGTNTSEPGSGLGSLWTSSACTRVRTRPLA